ncbi:MAG: hypothetical protein NTV68_09685 [Methanomicrobiales archaeon]|nr:hypothetical protein [Methanomicrobiales archaeon]
MGRSFQSVRMGVNDIAGRWGRAARAMRCDDAIYADKVVAMAKTYASEAFYAFDDPLEAAIFSVLLCMCREQKTDRTDDGHVVPDAVTSFPGVPSYHSTENFPRRPENWRV